MALLFRINLETRQAIDLFRRTSLAGTSIRIDDPTFAEQRFAITLRLAGAATVVTLKLIDQARSAATDDERMPIGDQQPSIFLLFGKKSGQLGDTSSNSSGRPDDSPKLRS